MEITKKICSIFYENDLKSALFHDIEGEKITCKQIMPQHKQMSCFDHAFM
jgi:hypothetical protein